MKKIILGVLIGGIIAVSCVQAQNKNENLGTATSLIDQVEPNPDDSTTWRELSADEKYVIVDKGTEYPGTGIYVDNHEEGVYNCKRCNAPLFKSDTKFESGTGWPSFDAYVKGSVKEVKDADGYRTEIVCMNCDAHLGHAFYGEGFTKKNTRHCVNSISLSFEKH